MANISGITSHRIGYPAFWDSLSFVSLKKLATLLRSSCTKEVRMEATQTMASDNETLSPNHRNQILPATREAQGLTTAYAQP